MEFDVPELHHGNGAADHHAQAQVHAHAAAPSSAPSLSVNVAAAMTSSASVDAALSNRTASDNGDGAVEDRDKRFSESTTSDGSGRSSSPSEHRHDDGDHNGGGRGTAAPSALPAASSSGENVVVPPDTSAAALSSSSSSAALAVSTPEPVTPSPPVTTRLEDDAAACAKAEVDSLDDDDGVIVEDYCAGIITPRHHSSTTMTSFKGEGIAEAASAGICDDAHDGDADATPSKTKTTMTMMKKKRGRGAGKLIVTRKTYCILSEKPLHAFMFLLLQKIAETERLVATDSHWVENIVTDINLYHGDCAELCDSISRSKDCVRNAWLDTVLRCALPTQLLCKPATLAGTFLSDAELNTHQHGMRRIYDDNYDVMKSKHNVQSSSGSGSMWRYRSRRMETSASGADHHAMAVKDIVTIDCKKYNPINPTIKVSVDMSSFKVMHIIMIMLIIIIIIEVHNSIYLCHI